MKIAKWIAGWFVDQEDVDEVARSSGAVTDSKPSFWSRVSPFSEVGKLDSNSSNGQYVETPTKSVTKTKKG